MNLASRPLHRVAKRFNRVYRRSVVAKSATGCGSPTSSRRSSAHNSIAGAFFVSAVSCYGGCARETFGSAGFLLPRSSTPAYSRRPIRVEAKGGGSHHAIGATPMERLHALSPSSPLHAHALAILGEAVIVNRVTGTSASRTRLLALVDMAYAVSVVSASERQAVIGGAK
ncbi:hypothetical protein FDK04_29270 [Pseudomonas aeruginosa]|nr:hypothetical protein [Pseudomonas aeruginosa]POP60851.1 hypothetical protein C3L32_03185 [Pseudomonas aeruginosa]QGQ06494.1 hypothetical protein FDK04_29270 [Pseudomonas aeruginosa]RCI43216.1 hypothetical protein DT379_26990 [Pseudomonas aeruginosa]RCI54917.1 hypothetical protein DT381_13020 [Pseudomonas aeruginosa]